MASEGRASGKRPAAKRAPVERAAAESRPGRRHALRTEVPLGHGEVLAGLWRAAQRGRLPHALLFDGPDGVGKFLAAERFARGLVCDEGPGEPCGACGPCKRTAGANYADLHVVDVAALDRTAIKICYMTLRTDDASKKEMNGDVEDNVDTFLSLKAAESRWKLVLIRDAERMTTDAQNALLKNLEEPGERTLLVLVSGHVDRLLETIRSRCVRVRFGGIDAESCARVIAEHGVTGERAERLARWSGGAPGAALELERLGAEELVERVVGALTGREAPLAAARAAAEVKGAFRGATDSQKARHRAQVAVDLARAVATDRARVCVGVPVEELAFGVEATAVPADVAGERAARDAVDALLEARQDVERSMNPDGILDRAFLALGRLAPRPAREPAGRRR